MDEQLKSNLTSVSHWLRVLYMVLFVLIMYVASFVVGVLIIVQFFFSLFAGQANPNLKSFGYSLTVYIKQSLMFLCYNSEQKPFPFDDWPETPQASAQPSAEPTETPLASETTADFKDSSSKQAEEEFHNAKTTVLPVVELDQAQSEGEAPSVKGEPSNDVDKEPSSEVDKQPSSEDNKEPSSDENKEPASEDTSSSPEDKAKKSSSSI